MILSVALSYALLMMAHRACGYTEEALQDEIVQLPGAPSLKSKHFSGFLQLSPAKFVHYYYIESERDPATDSLVYWTNGGPGCSGMIGMFTEMGPWRPTSNATLEENPYAWTSVANMVFLEQPVGVGFSYTLDDTLIKNFNDFRASVDNLAIVKLFLQRFPELAERDFYLSSESYGGHYIPHWTLQILNDPSDLKNRFRGFLVGNPYTSFASSGIAGINVLWGQQLVPKPVWDFAVAGTCNLISHDAYFLSMYLPICFDVINTLMNYTAALNPYALDFDVCPFGNGISSSSKMHRLHSGSRQVKALQAAQRRSHEVVQAMTFSPQPLPEGADKFSVMDERSISLAKMLLQEMQTTASSRAQASPEDFASPMSSASDSTRNEDIEYHPCTEINTIAYLNNPEVQSALHVDIQGRPRHWQPCSDAVNGHWSMNDFLADTTALYSKIFNHPAKRKDFKMLVYSGDSDGVCATVGTQYWIYNIQNAKVLSLFKPWAYNHHRYGRQQGGFLTQFTRSLAFATVHHAGHEVLAYQPESALELFQCYLNGSLFVTSETENSSGESSFDEAIERGGEVLVIVIATLIVVVAIVAIGCCSPLNPSQDPEGDIDQGEDDAVQT